MPSLRTVSVQLLWVEAPIAHSTQKRRLIIIIIINNRDVFENTVATTRCKSYISASWYVNTVATTQYKAYFSVDDFTQSNGTTVTQLACKAAKLMTGITMRRYRNIQDGYMQLYIIQTLASLSTWKRLSLSRDRIRKRQPRDKILDIFVPGSDPSGSSLPLKYVAISVFSTYFLCCFLVYKLAISQHFKKPKFQISQMYVTYIPLVPLCCLAHVYPAAPTRPHCPTKSQRKQYIIRLAGGKRIHGSLSSLSVSHSIFFRT